MNLIISVQLQWPVAVANVLFSHVIVTSPGTSIGNDIATSNVLAQPRFASSKLNDHDGPIPIWSHSQVVEFVNRSAKTSSWIEAVYHVFTKHD